ncbi:MAG: TIGR00366 family protein [Planctomycetes bacterium]|nr:TIGR00366 family protein [Planctomycetota bacterium]
MTEQPRSAGAAREHGPRNGGTGLFARFLAVIEWLGNLLPHPVTLFALFALGVILVSGLCGLLDVQVDDPRPVGAGGRDPSGLIVARSLMTGEGLRWIATHLVTNFTSFVPLGTVLVALLGVGVAEKSGLLSAAIRGLVLAAPRHLITVVVVFAGVLSNTASEMGYVVLIPLAAVIFHSVGRHPLAGLAAAFAGVSGGYSANLLIGTVDPLLAGITEESARFIDPTYEVHPAVNWYFMIASTFMITAIGSWVTARIVEPRLGAYDPAGADDSVDHNPSLERLSPGEKRGLKHAAIAALVTSLLFVVLAGPQFTTVNVGPDGTTVAVPVVEGLKGTWNSVTGIVPLWGVLRDPVQNTLMPSPFLKSIVAMIFVFFVVPGFVYGRSVGSMRGDRDVIDGMAAAMSSMGLYIVLVFFAAQFVAFFKWTNLGAILAVVGADALIAIGLDNALVFIPFILMCCFVNLMLGSASAQWAVTAPIFVPMLMTIGYSPEVIQAAYRIGDSTTNIITPMMSYFGLILAFACRYDRNLGIGTLISTMLPYSILFLLGWIALFYLWVFGLGIPVGPGAPTYFEFGGVG